MTLLAAAGVAAAVTDAGTAIALDDGTVWMVAGDGWEELGACDDGDVVALTAAGDRLVVECGDGSGWTWSDDAGWEPRVEVVQGTAPDGLVRRSWWPLFELSVRMRDEAREPPIYEGWVRLRWNL